MNIHIVGGNSQVGTELALLYRGRGHDVVPVVRSRRSTWFLDHAGFDCRVADVTDEDEASDALRGADVIIIAAFAPKHTRDGFRPDVARETNTALARHSVECAPDDSTVVYFSTVHAFGETVGPSDWTWYGREKRAAEKQLLKTAERCDHSGFVFRLGHVFGANQNKTRKIARPIERSEYERVKVNPEKPSNVVHTVTIADAVLTCHRTNHDSGIYTVVNDPQWTWGEVYDYYTEESTTVSYTGDSATGEQSLPVRVFSGVLRVLEPYRAVLTSFLLYAPEPVNRRLSQRARKSTVKSNISEYKDNNTFHTHEFDYAPAPGPYLDGLRPASELFEEYSLADTALGRIEEEQGPRTEQSE